MDLFLEDNWYWEMDLELKIEKEHIRTEQKWKSDNNLENYLKWKWLANS